MVKIIFGTLTGNTERVAQYLKEQIDMSELSAELHRAENTNIDIFNNDDQFIVMASTWNLGEMNQFLAPMYEALDGADLSGVKVAFVGLGDSIYGDEHFCKSIIDFRAKAKEKGVVELVDPLYIDGEPEMVLETEVKKWSQQLIEKLKKN